MFWSIPKIELHLVLLQKICAATETKFTEGKSYFGLKQCVNQYKIDLAQKFFGTCRRTRHQFVNKAKTIQGGKLVKGEYYLRFGNTILKYFSQSIQFPKSWLFLLEYLADLFPFFQYFNKIQCFCFEEQRLNPGEEVDMPVFFYIDPEFLEDPNLEKSDIITLSYTFFESKPGLVLPSMSQ